VVPLTSRELEVLQLLATGRSNRAIADELVVSLDTVKRHVTHILDKLEVANRTQAVIRARELGLLR
jgi:LuxR family maltose regulon positive regulatory protein